MQLQEICHLTITIITVEYAARVIAELFRIKIKSKIPI